MVKKDPKWLRAWKRKEKKAKTNWTPYVERNKVLKEIGFNTYKDYLLSELWLGIRTKRLADHPNCSCCERAADIVHHDTYYKKLLLGDEISVKRDLYPLCRKCHYRVELDGDRKRSWGEAIKQFRRMLFKFKHGVSKSQMIRAKTSQRKASRKKTSTTQS